METPNSPFPGTVIKIFNETELSYFNNYKSKVDIRNQQETITNYEYEDELNNNLQTIRILKPEYLGVLIGDLRNMMKYDKSSDYIDSKTKKVYNPKKTGI